MARHSQPPLHRFEAAAQRFQHIHVDFVGPMTPNRGYKYLFTCIDHYSRYAVAVPTKTMSTEHALEALIHGWIQFFGIAGHITSDGGAAFVSGVWLATALPWACKYTGQRPTIPSLMGW